MQIIQKFCAQYSDTFICIYVYMYICMYVYLYIYFKMLRISTPGLAFVPYKFYQFNKLTCTTDVHTVVRMCLFFYVAQYTSV